MFRFLWPIIRLNTKHSNGTFSKCVRTDWMYQYYVLYLARWWVKETETRRRIFNIDYQYILLCYWLDKLLYKMVSIFSSNLCEIHLFLILRTERDMMKNVHWSLCEAPLFSCQILRELEFSRQILEKYWDINFHGNLPVVVELFCAEGKEANSHF